MKNVILNRWSTASLRMLALLGGVAAAGCAADEATETSGDPTPVVAAPAPSQRGVYVTMTRPANVPERFVATPNGWFDPDCVIALEEDEYQADDGSIRRRDGLLRHAAKRCASPRYDVRGELVVDLPGPFVSKKAPISFISWDWIEHESSFALGAMSFVRASWTVPAAPLHDSGQVLYFFPGLQDTNPSTRILQPVLGWSQDSATAHAWTLQSWNCCVAGTTTHSGFVPAVAGTTVSGDMQGTNCNPTTGVCSNWSIVSRNAAGASVTLNTTVSSPMDWLVANAFEVYAISNCNQLPPNGSSVASSFVLRDIRGTTVPAPDWDDVAASGLNPSCVLRPSHTATTATLAWASLSGGFWHSVQSYLDVSPPLDFGLPSSWQVIAGDFDGDGNDDYARLADRGAWIFFSNSHNLFETVFQPYPASLNFGLPSPWTPISGDFNGDGRTDYARLGGTVAWIFYANADRSFTAVSQSYPGLDFRLPSTWQVVTGDFNRDRRTDYARLGGTGAWVYYGRTDNTFTSVFQSYVDQSPPLDFGENSTWESIAGDFNGDGMSDYARVGATGAWVFYGNLNKTFTRTFQTYQAPAPALNFGQPATSQLIAGDFNGDFRTDYARLDSIGAWVFFGNADKTFTRQYQGYLDQEPTHFGAPSAWTPITGDFNGDGRTDYARLGSTGAAVFMGNANGTFGRTFQTYDGGVAFGQPSSWQVVTGDFGGHRRIGYARLGGTEAHFYIPDHPSEQH